MTTFRALFCGTLVATICAVLYKEVRDVGGKVSPIKLRSTYTPPSPSDFLRRRNRRAPQPQVKSRSVWYSRLQ